MLLRTAGVILLPLFTLQALPAQTTGVWTLVTTVTSPPAPGSQMVYDAARDRMVLFCGTSVWEFDGVHWIGPIPDPVGQHRMWWDPQTSQVRQLHVVYSGSLPVSASIRSWNGVGWTTITTTAPPIQRLDEGSFVYDTFRNVAVWYLGNNNRSDTWEWNGITWMQISAGGPVPRTGESLVVDEGRNQSLIFGGLTTQGPRNDSWTWAGGGWSEYFGVNSPPPRSGATVGCDPVRNRVVLFGGEPAPSTALDDTWEWDGIEWTPVSTTGTPPPLTRAAMAFDSLRNRFVMFGGYDATGSPTNQTWSYQGVNNQVATFTQFGTGCSGGTLGAPALAAAPGSLPRLGATFQMQMTNIPATVFNVPLGFAGFDATSWNGVPLPVPLDILGFTGCQAWIAPELTAALANSSGTAPWSVLIPFDLTLMGFEFFAQGAVLAVGANPGGLLFSNAGHAIVGL